MKKNILLIALTFVITLVISACNTMPVENNFSDIVESKETLYVYNDGRMRLNSRFLDTKDVVIYSDGQGGEKAAVKVRMPIHSDFYRDSILVVRVVDVSEESVARNESNSLSKVN